MVLCGHSGIKSDVVQRLYVPLAVLSVNSRNIRVRAVRQRITITDSDSLEHLAVCDEPHGKGLEFVRKRLVYQQRLIDHGLRLSGNACAVKSGQRIGDKNVIRKRARAAAADRARILGIPGDGHERHAAGDGAAAAGHAVRHARAGDAADIAPAGKRALCPAIFDHRTADARDAADIIAALALCAAVGLTAVDQAEIHPAADRRRAVLFGCDCTAGNAALQNGAQFVLFTLGRRQTLADIAFGVGAGLHAHRARDAADISVSLHRARVFAAAQRAHGDALRIGLRAVGYKIAVFQTVHSVKDGRTDLVQLVADGLHVFLQRLGQIRRL